MVEPIEFKVYLKKIGEPVTIHASKFDKTTLKFYWQQQYDGAGEMSLTPELIRNIYLAPSAVVAVVPSTGLIGEVPSRWSAR
jgi:hypothetical protein